MCVCVCVCVFVCVCVCLCVCVCVCICDRTTLYPYLTIESVDRFSQNLIEQYANIDHPHASILFSQINNNSNDYDNYLIIG